MNIFFTFISENADWIFSGIGIFVLSLVLHYKKKFFSKVECSENKNDEKNNLVNEKNTIGGNLITGISNSIVNINSNNKYTEEEE